MKEYIKCIAAVVLFAAMSFPAFAELVALTVPNYSFEAPVLTTTNSSETIDIWEDRGATGVFKNTGVFGQIITNADGVQLAYMDCRPVYTNGQVDNIWQLTSSLLDAATTYTLTVGVASRSDKTLPNEAGTKMQLRLYYLVGTTATTLVAKEVVYSDLSDTMLTFYSATLNAVDIPTAAIGKAVGIQLISTAGTTGAWTLDNVTLTSIPEPATMLLLGLGGLGLFKRRR